MPTIHGQAFPIGPRELIGGLLDFAEKFADQNGEPDAGACREAIARGEAWFESGSATIDPLSVASDLAEYVARYADLTKEPQDGNCRRLLQEAAALQAQATDAGADRTGSAQTAASCSQVLQANTAGQLLALLLGSEGTLTVRGGTLTTPGGARLDLRALDDGGVAGEKAVELDKLFLRLKAAGFDTNEPINGGDCVELVGELYTRLAAKMTRWKKASTSNPSGRTA